MRQAWKITNSRPRETDVIFVHVKGTGCYVKARIFNSLTQHFDLWYLSYAYFKKQNW